MKEKLREYKQVLFRYIISIKAEENNRAVIGAICAARMASGDRKPKAKLTDIDIVSE